MKDKLSELRWFRIRVLFKSVRKSAVLLSMIQAIMKGSYLDVFPDFKWHDEGAAPLFFHPDGIKFNRLLNAGEKFQVTVILSGHSRAQAEMFCAALEKRMSVPDNSLYYGFEGFVSFEARCFEDVMLELKKSVAIPESGEICLEFLLPYNGKKMKGKDASHLEKSVFIHDLEKRFSRLSGLSVKYESERDDFRIVPCYWDYVEVVQRNSRSNPGTKQFINGFAGKLYIKGIFPDFIRFLVAGTELHAGTKVSFGYGYYQLHTEPVSYFEPRFPDRKALVSVINDTLEKYDAVEYALESESLDPENFASELCGRIKNGTFMFSPNQAFRIKKKSGSERIIEKLSFTDMVVHQYLLRTVSGVLDRVLEEESVGFRKGMSRFKAETMIKSAINEGYCYVVESDIEEFFQSVDPARMQKLLDFYIPSADGLIRSLLNGVMKTGFVLDGRICVRERGVAQGSPLSPLLANLYLDDFDEKIKSLDIRLIRYADDFVILAKSMEQAEDVLQSAETFASSIGLRLKKEKTAIKHVSEGFTFLGIKFTGSESSEEDEDEELEKLFRKPLYITEPSLYLSVNGEALDLMKYGKLAETIPFRRISEIIVLEKSMLSTSVIRKCVDFKIPVTVTLDTGYFVTTIKPDSKAFFDISFLHRKRYDSLTETEYLCIAREFAAGKIEAYLELFRRKYSKGDNLVIKGLSQRIDTINSVSSVEEVRGHEGAAAKTVYEKLNFMIDNTDFHIKKRVRKNPDFINSLLNFGYYLLFSRINTTVRSLGLNPYLGFLHSPEDSYESFVCDIEELFRARIDRMIIRMINLKIIQKSDFTVGEKGAYLTKEGKRKFLNSFEGGLISADRKSGLSLKDEIYLQIMSFRKWAVQGDSLKIYKTEVNNAEVR